MKQYRASLDNTDVPSSRFDTVVEWLLMGLLAFMPLAFGVVHAWSEEVVIALSGAIVVCFLLKLIFHHGPGPTWTWAYVPLGFFLLIVIFQLVPLPAFLVNIISPGTAALKTQLLGDLPGADTALKSMTLSFYPNATRGNLRLILSVAAVFIVVLNVFHHPARIKRLLMAIALIGGIIAVLALAQNLFGNGKIYWFVSSSHCKGYSGPFVNHNNYGQFMNLSIGAALALLMVKLHEGFISSKITSPVVFEHLTSSSAKSLWLLVAVMGLGAATIFVSLTRGGMVSMLISITFTTLLITSRQSLKGHGWIMVVMALVALICILYIGFDGVYDRMVTLRDFDKVEGGRLQILKDIAIAWTKFPILGTGLGTHAVVYPMFDRSTNTALAAHAENEYAQAAEETGLLGLVSLIIFGIIIGSNYIRNIRNTNLPICSAVYGLGFGLLAILIHSLSDFGQHLPANAILCAIFCALLLALARWHGLPARENTAKPVLSVARASSPWKHGQDGRATGMAVLLPCLRVIVLLGVFAIWLWAFTGANNARIAEAHWEEVLTQEKRLKDRDWKGTNAEYAFLISHATAALEYQPDNIIYRHWLNVYR